MVPPPDPRPHAADDARSPAGPAHSHSDRLIRALRMVAGAAEAVMRSPDEKSLLKNVLQCVVSAGGYRLAWVSFTDRGAGMPVAWEAGDGVSLNELAPHRILRGRKLALAHDASRGVATNADPGHLTSLALPLRDGHKVLGALTVHAATPEDFGGEELDQLLRVADNLAYGLRATRAKSERERYEKALTRQATRDILTGLPNRTLLADRMQQAAAHAARNDKLVAIVVLDLDDFKVVNDTLGHDAGDTLLRQTATRIRACLRRRDTVARLGGDEFAVVIDDVKHVSDVVTVVEKIRSAIAAPYDLDGHPGFVTPTMGVTLYPVDDSDIQNQLRNADTAMYHAKAAGKNNYRFYTAEMNRRLAERAALEAGLRRALERGELRVVYQPKVRLADGQVTGLEALVRWDRPGEGAIPPARFIPVAEECGLIVPLGEWILREACREFAGWRGDGLAPVKLAVNLSPRQFRHAHLPRQIAAILNETGFPGGDLELEITEGAIMHDRDAANGILATLKSLGVSVAMDDFGTGYSSLGYLHTFPIDTLKIDRIFVNDITRNADAAAICRAVVAMASSLGMETVAEGAETAAQVAYLRALGCDTVQGYFFAPPLPAAEARELVASGRRFDSGAQDHALPVAVLLLHDEQDAAAAREALAGTLVVAASNPEEALNALSLHGGGALLADDDPDAIDLFRKVARLHPDTVRILVARHEASALLGELTDAVHCVLVRPWTADALATVVQEAVRVNENASRQERMLRSLRQTNEALNASNARLEARAQALAEQHTATARALDVERQVLDTVPLAVLGLDPDGTIVLANSEALHLFGDDENPCIGAELGERLPELARIVDAGWSDGELIEAGRMFRVTATRLAAPSSGTILIIRPFP